VPNPWDGVTRQRRTMKTKAAATRDVSICVECDSSWLP
jgi:hypothetical protein